MKMGAHASGDTSKLKSALALLVMIALVALLSGLLRAYVFQPFEIPSRSMEETIVPGDMVFSEKVSYYFHDPEAGDIVTFADPANENRTLIKRCIATGGQVVSVSEDGSLYIDGVLQEEAYVKGKPSFPQNEFIRYPYTIPEGFIWVMGDNRTDSMDSRTFGAIPISSVSGRAVVTYWPLNRIGLF